MKSRQSKSATLASATYPHGTGVRSLALLHAAAILLLALLGGTVFCTRVHAQTSYGGIVGTVTDSTGATVPGARTSRPSLRSSLRYSRWRRCLSGRSRTSAA